MRLADTQVWPALRYFEAMAPLPPQGQALDRRLDIGIFKDDERRVAAQFERELFDGAAHCSIKSFAGLGRTREGQLANNVSV
jgi:hypothetical protein